MLLLAECECGFLVSEHAVEGGVGKLAGVEDFAGSFGVDGVARETLGDVAGDLGGWNCGRLAG